jgi:hypothetical protein
MNNSRRPSKNTQPTKLPKTAKELKELQKAITESLKQIADKELEDSEEGYSSEDSDGNGMQPETITIESDPEEELDDDFNDAHSSDHSSSSSDSGHQETIAIDSDPDEELDDDFNDEHSSDHSSSTSNTGRLSKDLNFTDQDTSNEKNKHEEQYNPDDNDSEEEPEEPDLGNTSDPDVEAELKGAGKITPYWYSDADKGLLRRRMGVKADLPLQEQNAIVRTLRKLVRMKCGSDLNKPWSTYGRIAQNRMITSMYNVYHTRCS